MEDEQSCHSCENEQRTVTQQIRVFFPREVFLIKCRFEQGVLHCCDVPTHLFSNACLSEAFRCNFRHSTTIRHKHVVLLFANNNGWTIPPMGNKCCPRVGSVFLTDGWAPRPGKRDSLDQTTSPEQLRNPCNLKQKQPDTENSSKTEKLEKETRETVRQRTT